MAVISDVAGGSPGTHNIDLGLVIGYSLHLPVL